MDYIDWIVSSGIFLLVIIGLFVYLPNYLPLNSTTENDYLTTTNIFQTIATTVDNYTIINNSTDNEIYPYLLEVTNQEGRATSPFTNDGNVVYGTVGIYPTNYLDFANDDSIDVSPQIIKKETFEDYNYLDTFSLTAGTSTVSQGTLNIDNDTIITSEDSYSNFSGYVNINANDINIYFNYSDASNSYLCAITSTHLKLYNIHLGSSTLLVSTVTDKTTEWQKVYFGANYNNLISCGIDSNIISETDEDNASGQIVISGIDLNSYIDNFEIYANSDVNANEDSNSIETINSTIDISDTTATVQLFKNEADTIDFNIETLTDLTVSDSNYISIVKDTSDNSRMVIFPQTNEFWTIINTDENINFIFDNNTQVYGIPYYIEDDDGTDYIWTIIDILDGETKTIYIYKYDGYYPDPTLIVDVNDWDNNTPDVNLINAHLCQIDITNEGGDESSYKVKIPTDVCTVSGTDDSLFISSNLIGVQNNIQFQKVDTTKYALINAFDFYNNLTDCNFSIIDNGLNINNCDTNTILRMRYRDGTLDVNYPSIEIIKNTERIITFETIDDLSDSNSYYISIVDQDINISIGNEFFTTGKLFERYSKYLTSDNRLKRVKVLIKSN